MRIRNFVIMMFLCLMALCSCGGGGKLDAEFRRIDSLCDSEQEQAIHALDSLAYKSLSEKERHWFDLLTIKSRDKVFIAQQAYRLVLEVIDYYDKHRSEGHYAETLYYGGRVYSDIGDLPTALEFFQKSLKEIPDGQDHLKFRRNVMNQLIGAGSWSNISWQER